MEYTIRNIKENEIDILEDFLYEAIFIPEGVKPPAKEIIFQPELQVYISDFGKCKGDIGLVAELNTKIVGAVWVRIMNDYGHIDDNTPSVAISLYKEYRNLGIGTAMMKTIISTVRTEGYKQVSLAVQKANYAVKMLNHSQEKRHIFRMFWEAGIMFVLPNTSFQIHKVSDSRGRYEAF